MKFQQFIIVFLLLSTTCLGQVKQEVNFKKKGKKRTITLVLPKECSVLTKYGERVHRSSLYARNDSTLFFLKRYLDAVETKSIWKNASLNNKEKKELLDSLYNADTMTVAINIKDIEKVTFHTTSAKQVRYKFRFVGLGVVFIATGGLLIYTLIDSAGNASVGDYFAVASYPASFALWFSTAQLRLKTEKWEIK